MEVTRMGESQNAAVLITLPKPYLHILRKMAAEQTFNNPDKKVSAAGLAREIICQYLDNLDPGIKARLISTATL
jgi:hypothetical protein